MRYEVILNISFLAPLFDDIAHPNAGRILSQCDYVVRAQREYSF